MNFENLKHKMDQDAEKNSYPIIVKKGQSNLPVEKIRMKMKGEIMLQIVVIVLFFYIPKLKPMHELPKGIYFIAVFLICLMTFGYLIKMIFMLKHSTSITSNSKIVLGSFLTELKLTIEVYKTGCISSSLLLPLPLLSIYYGSSDTDPQLFYNLITLNITYSNLILILSLYIIAGAVIYYSIIQWVYLIYGKQIKELEILLTKLKDE